MFFCELLSKHKNAEVSTNKYFRYSDVHISKSYLPHVVLDSYGFVQ